MGAVMCPALRSLIPSTSRELSALLASGAPGGACAPLLGFQALLQLAEWPCLALEPGRPMGVLTNHLPWEDGWAALLDT